METDRPDPETLEILKYNGGFSRPEEWILYAKQHHFTKVASQKLHRCPDCHSPNYKKIGQFIHYSNLICLNACEHCNLLYADTILEDSTIQKHFDDAYKDEHYFKEMRRYVFDEIATLVTRLAPPSGDVLDVGGAKGHLLAMIGEHRPDLQKLLNDLSPRACEWASSQFHLEVFCGRFSASEFRRTFDVITMIDVIYYEPDLSMLWNRASLLIRDGGHLILRVPNRVTLIRSYLKVHSVLYRSRRDLQTSIGFLNPEHIYVMSRKYLRRRLASLGFEDVVFIPSAVLVKRPSIRWLYKLWHQVARLVHFGSLGLFTITPSLTVVARKVRRPS